MSKTVLTPIGGNILVKPIKNEVSASGIILPETVKSQKGEVVALGTGKLSLDGKKIEFNVKVGDVIIFKKDSPFEIDEIPLEGSSFLIMKEDTILAIIK